MPLIEADVGSLRITFPSHSSLGAATAKLFEGDLTPSELQALLACLTTCEPLLNSGRAVVLVGYGSQTRQTYDQLEATEGVDVLWRAPFVPSLLLPLALIAASYGGLVRVSTPQGLGAALNSLTTLGMVELYAIPEQYVPLFVSHVKVRKWRSRGLSVAGELTEYFAVGVDGDSSGSATGLYGWVSWGTSCPTEIIRCFTDCGGSSNPSLQRTPPGCD